MAASKPAKRPPDAARMAAVRILHDVLERGAFSNIHAIHHLDRQGMDARDRGFASALIYGTLSRIVTVDWLLAKVSHRDLSRLDPWTRTILRMGVWQLYWSDSIPARAAVDESVRLATNLVNPGAGSFVNAALRRLSREKPALPEKNIPILTSLSPEIFGCLRQWYGAAEAELMARSFLRDQTQVTGRVNVLRATPEQVHTELTAAGYAPTKGRYCSEAIALSLGGTSVRGLTAWQRGRLTIQDEAAMLVGYAAAPEPGQTIIDLCAAPGGKTCHLAEITGDKAAILAVDKHPERLKLVSENAGRLGVTKITCLLGDATGLGMPGDLAECADLVLADVPCSGLGLLAKKPEIRLTMSHKKMVGLYPLQEAILNYAATILKTGGTLIYSTCTVNPAENIDRVQKFLAEHQARFVLEPLDDRLPKNLLQHPDLKLTAAKGYIQLLPHRHDLDGFFIARIRRVG